MIGKDQKYIDYELVTTLEDNKINRGQLQLNPGYCREILLSNTQSNVIYLFEQNNNRHYTATPFAVGGDHWPSCTVQ